MPTIVIAADEMAADLVLAEGERVSAPSTVVVLLARQGVRHGLQHAVLAGLPGLVGPTAVRVALGDPAMPGRDGWVTCAFALPGAPGDLVDAAPLPVAPGQVLARRTPATPGQAGRTVTGRTLGFIEPADPGLLAGEGCEATDDGQAVVATRPGIAHLEGHTVVVRPFTVVPGDLGPDVGTLAAAGDLQVDGGVEGPCVVDAAGDIHVFGGVDGATLRAGGRIVVHGGVRREAELTAGGDVQLRFLERSSVTAGGHLSVEGDVVRGAVSATSARIGGAAVGGELVFTHWLEAGELGAESAVPTRVVVTPPPPPDSPARALQRERRAIDEQLTQLGMVLDENRRLAKDWRNDAAREMVGKLVALIDHQQARDRELAAQLAALPPPPTPPRPHVRVRGLLHPGVGLQVGEQHLKPTAAIPASLYLDDGAAVAIAPVDLALDPERTPS